MNQLTIRTFIREMITEVKKEVKMKKEEKLPKSSGKLMDLKKELAALKQMKDELQTAKFAEKTAETEVEFANLQKFAKELDKLKSGGMALESSIDAKISEIETRIGAEKNKIKEMIGLVPEAGQEKMVDEKKMAPAKKVVPKKDKELDEAKLKQSAIVTKTKKKSPVKEDASYNNMIRKKYTFEEKDKFEKIASKAKNYFDAVSKLEAAGCKDPDVFAEDFHNSPDSDY